MGTHILQGHFDFPGFARVHERRSGHNLMLIYTEPSHKDEIEEVVLWTEGFLLSSTLPPLRQHQYVCPSTTLFIPEHEHDASIS